MIMDLRIIERSKPHVEIKIRRDRHLWKIERLWRISNSGINLVYVADCPLTNHLYRLLELSAGTLLASHLQNSAIVPDSCLNG